MKKTFNIITIIALGVIILSSCDLTEYQQASGDRKMIFSSEAGIKNYVYSFYNQLPNEEDAFKQDLMSDYAAKNVIRPYEAGAYTPESSTSWGWNALRNINYFIKYNVDPAVDEITRNNYTGIAKFFRAYFYFDKLVTFGEVPWIDEPLEPNDPRLYAGRDSRDLIISMMIADLDYAYDNIIEEGITGNSNLINKWTPLLLKSRICLFEASWRKYHANTDYVKGCSITSNELYEAAADAAQLIMDEGPYGLHISGTKNENGRGVYRDLFVSDHPVTEEVMLALSLDTELNILGAQNRYYNSSSYGPHLCMTRQFAKTYLNIDGSFYNEKNGDGTYKTFVEETTGRDLRLNQTIRGYDYTRKNTQGTFIFRAANFTSHTLTGYMFTKYIVDDVAFDNSNSNFNDVPIFRFAEVLLNYAEAKAELGTLTDADWSATIGALRRRAGITGGALDTKPTEIDRYLQNTYYPQITDPVILEIRRERAIELCLEGFRMIDLKRWACGNLWEDDDWTGVYIPALEKPLDMNGDGTYDVFFTDNLKYKGEHKGIASFITGNQQVKKLEDDPNGGYIMFYNEPSRTWNDNMYLYPIPAQVRAMNPALSQNPGW